MAMSANKALLGKRVYRGVSQSPNKGQVSAKGARGYLQRELRNKAQLRTNRQRGMAVANPKGRDGKSDMRSGVAAQALNRMAGKGPGSRPLGGRPLVGTKDMSQGFQNEGRPIAGGAQGGGGGPVGGPPKAPQVQINDAGLLELPYNNDFAMEQYTALNDANQQLLGLKAEGDQQALEYQQGRREADLNYGQMKRQTLNENAARGTAFSSAYGTAAANNANAYANQVSGLDAQNASFRNNQAMQRAAIQSALNQQLQLATLGYGNDLAEQAGSLGFGNAAAPVHKTDKSGKPKGRGGKSKGRGSKSKGRGSKAKGGSKGPRRSSGKDARSNRRRVVANARKNRKRS